MKIGNKVIIKETNQIAVIMQIDEKERFAQVYFEANYKYYLWFSLDELILKF